MDLHATFPHPESGEAAEAILVRCMDCATRLGQILSIEVRQPDLEFSMESDDIDVDGIAATLSEIMAEHGVLTPIVLHSTKPEPRAVVVGPDIVESVSEADALDVAETMERRIREERFVRDVFGD